MDSPSSDETIDDLELENWGHPLTRMRDDTLYAACATILLGGAHGHDDDNGYNDDASDSSSVVYDIDFEEYIDNLLEEDSTLSTRPISHQKIGGDPRTPFTLLTLETTSSHLLVQLVLNHRDLRPDPWNPAPHIICAVDRAQSHDSIFLCLKHLVPYNRIPFRTVSNWIDMFRQLLEGLTFLHENGILHGGLDVNGLEVDEEEGVPLIMVDISADPIALEGDRPEDFDRTKYPVKYYFANLEKARQLAPRQRQHGAHRSNTMPSSLIDGHGIPSTSSPRSGYSEDIHALGHIIASLLPNLPHSPLKNKLVSLTRSMIKGTLLTAEESRKLFEVLVEGVEGSVLAERVSPKIIVHTQAPPESSTLDTQTGREQNIVVDLGTDTEAKSEPTPKLQPKRPGLPFGSLGSVDHDIGAKTISPPLSPREIERKQGTRIEEEFESMTIGHGLGVNSDKSWADDELNKGRMVGLGPDKDTTTAITEEQGRPLNQNPSNPATPTSPSSSPTRLSTLPPILAFRPDLAKSLSMSGKRKPRHGRSGHRLQPSLTMSSLDIIDAGDYNGESVPRSLGLMTGKSGVSGDTGARAGMVRSLSMPVVNGV
ncbi:hypothetical protein WG66_014516 [Moniliophthora roreri]|nr:hypothetical protein WG66_014516 [Moniliophthora roreri]